MVSGFPHSNCASMLPYTFEDCCHHTFFNICAGVKMSPRSSYSKLPPQLHHTSESWSDCTVNLVCRYRDVICQQLQRECNTASAPIWRQSKDMLQEEGIEVTPQESDQSGAAAPAPAEAQVQVHPISLLFSLSLLLCCSDLLRLCTGLCFCKAS